MKFKLLNPLLAFWVCIVWEHPTHAQSCSPGANRQTLINFYNQTGGAAWTNTWDLNRPMSEWYGVTLNIEGCVEKIELAGNNLSGTLPDLNLSGLIELVLASNSLSGSLPNFTNLPALQVLDVSRNQLSGTIPNVNLPNLHILFLWDNDFTGSVPNFSSLPNLEILQLGANNLAGTIPDFNNLRKLEVMDLWVNQFSGIVPDFDLPELYRLDVSNNQIDNLPEFTRLPALDELVVNNNRLTFEDLLPNQNKAKTRFKYDSQDQVGTERTVTLPEGVRLELVSGAVESVLAVQENTVYDWFKDGSLIKTIFQVDRYSVSLNAERSDAGTYTCRISNSELPDLILQSRPITVQIQSSPDCAVAKFAQLVDQKTLTLYNQSTNASAFLWSFGDGTTSTDANPIHTYTNEGTYDVCLRATGACGIIEYCSKVKVQNCQEGAELNYKSGLPTPAMALFVYPSGEAIVGSIGGIAKYDVAGNLTYGNILKAPGAQVEDIEVGSDGRISAVGTQTGAAGERIIFYSGYTPELFGGGQFTLSNGANLSNPRLAIDNQLNIYLAGNFSGVLDIKSSLQLSAGGAGTAFFVARFDKNLNVLSAFAVPNANIADMALSGDGGTLSLTGTQSGAADYDPGAATALLNLVSPVFTAQYSTTGAFLKVYSPISEGAATSSSDLSASLVSDPLNNVFVSGEYFSSQTSPTFITKHQPNGSLSFRKTIVKPGSSVGRLYTGPSQIALDQAGRIFVGGGFGNTVCFDNCSQPEGTFTKESGISDAFVARYKSDGTYDYGFIFTEPGYNGVFPGAASSIVKIQTDAVGNLYVLGNFEKGIDIDPGAGEDIVQNTGYYLIKYIQVCQTPQCTLQASATQVQDTKCGEQNGAATISVQGGSGNYTYEWNNGLTVATANNLAPGAYKVVVKDGPSCFSEVNFTIQGSSSPLIALKEKKDANCGQSNGAISVNVSQGIAPYTYQWVTGSTTNAISNVKAGSYELTVRDAVGCTAQSTLLVSDLEGAKLSVSSIQGATCGLANGSATVVGTGGSGLYTYKWSNNQTSPTATGLAAGVYTVEVTDSDACKAQQTITIPGTTAPTLVLNKIVNATCGLANGSIGVIANGGGGAYSYVWNTGVSGNTINNLAPGTYSVTVTDANTCTAKLDISIEEIALPSVNIVSITDAACGQANGSAQVVGAGGGGSYSYTWSNGQLGPLAVGLRSGVYTVSLSDANNCKVIKDINISDIGGPVVSAASTTASSCEQANGSIRLSIVEGTPPYAVTWSNGASGTTLNRVAGGEYAYLIEDARSCTFSGSTKLDNIGLLPRAAAISYNVLGNQVRFSAEVKDADTYFWTFGNGKTAESTHPEVTYDQAGTYDVCLVIGNACGKDTVCTRLQVQGCTALTVNGSATPSSCEAPTGTASIRIANPPVGIMYTWLTTPRQTGPTALGLKAGRYQVEYSYGACKDTLSIIVPSAGPDPTADFAVAANGLTLVFENKATNADKYYWDFGNGYFSFLATPGPVVYTAEGTYLVSLIATNPCGSDTITKSINVISTAVEPALIGSLKLYPNPNAGPFTLEVDSRQNGIMDVKVYNSLGQALLQRSERVSVGENKFRFETLRMVEGMYYVYVSVEGLVKVVKMEVVR